MKRLRLLLLCTLFLPLAACLGGEAPPEPLPPVENTETPAPPVTQAPPGDWLEPYPLTARDRELLAAVGQSDVLLFRFHAPAEARQIALCLDSLGPDGLWSTRELGAIHLGGEDAREGTAALRPTEDGGFACVLQGGNGAASLLIGPPAPEERTDFSGRVVRKEGQAIRLDEQIPLLLVAYGETSQLTLPALEAYSQTALLQDLPHTWAISLVFQNE